MPAPRILNNQKSRHSLGLIYLYLPAGELGVDELQLEVFDEESICIEGLYPTPAIPARPGREAINEGSLLATGNLAGKIGDPSFVNWFI